MLTINRKIMLWKMKTHYFVRSSTEKEKHVHIYTYPHSFIPGKKSLEFETIQFDLTKESNELLMEMNKSTRRQIRRASEEPFTFVYLEKPTDRDLLAFQKFYNEFAKDKGTHLCNRFHMQTMKLLRDQHALVLTAINDKDGQQLCIRVYIVDKELVMNLYSASHYRMSLNTDYKRLLGQANRYLIWTSLCHFKEKGCLVYDMGGLTDNRNIREFKLGFGGQVVPVYSGYEGQSVIGHVLVKLREWKMSFTKMRDVQ